MTRGKRINVRKLKNQKITLTFDVEHIKKRTYEDGSVDFTYAVKFNGQVIVPKLHSYHSKTIQELKNEIIEKIIR